MTSRACGPSASRRLGATLVGVLVGASIGVAVSAADDVVPAARVQEVREFLSRMAEAPPTVSLRAVDSVVDIRVQGTFHTRSTGTDPGDRARAFLEDGGVAAKLGFVGQCRVRTVNDADPSGPTVVRFDFYDGEARIDGAEAIVHVAGDEITYVGGTHPLRSPVQARAAAGSTITPERAREIALDRLHAKGWTPDNRWVRRYKDRVGDPNPFDPETDIKVSLLIPDKGPSLVYDVNTTCAGYGFWVDAHSGQIVREVPPFEPEMPSGSAAQAPPAP